MKHTRVVRRALSTLVIAAMLAVGFVSVQSTFGAGEPALALNGSQFDPGNIISDQYFFDDAAMTEAQIQSFLQAKIGGCSNANCLNVLRASTPNRPASYTNAGSLVCNAYSGAANESASAIIFKVQQACGISAKVLLVTLQKEQGLVTNSGPSNGKLERAMGYGCPDNNDGVCAAEYYGFANQMYWATWQLKRYGTPTVFGYFQPGSKSIQWHPNASCGASWVNIQNRATAALYNYTPYQPNAAALGNLYGTGDDCSSYGNRNFWRIFSDWFGSPTLPPGSPIGELSSVTTSLGKIGLSGWAVDPSALTTVLDIHIKVDDRWVAWKADGASPGVDARVPGAGNQHGFQGEFEASGGTHRVCVFAVNIGDGANLTLGCENILVPDGSPAGEVKDIWATPNHISLWGWAGDRDVPSANTVLHISVNDQWFVLTADSPYPPPTQILPNAGPNTAFGGTLQVPSGQSNVCVYAINVGNGTNTTLLCETLNVPDGSPVGDWTVSKGVESAMNLAGWAAEEAPPNGKVDIHIKADGVWYVATANQPSPGVTLPFRDGGTDHGWSMAIPASAGAHQVCAWAINKGIGSNLELGCRSIVVPGPVMGSGAVSVKSSSSQLLPGATIEIRKTTCDGAPVWRTTTTTNPAAYGAFGISLPVGTYCIITINPPAHYGTAPPVMATVQQGVGNWFTVWLPPIVDGALVAKDSMGNGVDGVTALIRAGSCAAPEGGVWQSTTATGRWSSGGFGISLAPGTYCASAVTFPPQYGAPSDVDFTVTSPGPVWVTLWMKPTA